MATPSITSFFKTASNTKKDDQAAATTTSATKRKRDDDNLVLASNLCTQRENAAGESPPKKMATTAVRSAKQTLTFGTQSVAKRAYEINKRVRSFQSKEFDWVVHDNIKDIMYCKPCSKYPDLADRSAAIVKGTGTYRIDTLKTHGKSDKHNICLARFKADDSPEDIPLRVAVRRYATKLDDTTQQRMERLMNTALFITKENMSFTNFHGLCELQHKNGADMGQAYQYDVACRQFVHSIAEVEREHKTDEARESSFLCILADGSTDSSQTEQEAVFIRYVNKEGEPVTMLCDIVPAADAHAIGVKAALDTGLAKLGIDESVLKKKLVGCNFDGAAVMMWKKSGVATLYKQLLVCPWTIVVHCVAHNLELAVLDLTKELPCVSQVEETVKAIFKWYYYSPKRRREVNRIAEILDESHVYFSGVHQVRWLASRSRAFAALQKHLVAAVTHLQHAASLTGADAAKANGFLKQLTDRDFVESLHFMLDVMEVLANISVNFHQDGLFITDVIRKLELVD